MSLIVGQYYRGNPKQKPKQWGALCSVASNVYSMSGKVGIPCPSGVFPLWENTGLPYDVFSGEKGVLYGSTPPQWSFGPYGTNLVISANNTGLHYEKCIAGMGYASSDKWSVFAIAACDPTVSNYSPVAHIGSQFDSYWHGLYAGYYNTYGNTFFAVDTYQTVSTTKVDVSSTKEQMIYHAGANYSNNFRKVWSNVNNTIISAENSGTAVNRYVVRRLGIGIRANKTPVGDKPTINLVYFWKDYALTDNDFVFLCSNPYYLLQKPTVRTYFDLAEAGTTLSFTSINSNSDLNNNFLSAIRLLNPTNISCFTEISASIISGLVNLISGNDLLADSQITQASVQAIRKLIGQEISSLSQITDIVISTAKQFNLTDLNSLTEVTNVVFSVINQINNNDLLSNSQVINLAIDVIRQININSIKSISDITEVILSITGGIRGIDVEAQTEITSLALSILKVLKENNVESNSSVNEATLNVIHQLDFNNISSLSEITDIVTVAGSNIGINDNNSLTQITQVILDIIKAVSPININIQSEIDNPVINVLRTLFSNTVNVISNVTSVGVTNISTIATGKVTITFSMAVPSISWSLE